MPAKDAVQAHSGMLSHSQNKLKSPLSGSGNIVAGLWLVERTAGGSGGAGSTSALRHSRPFRVAS
jgi:hypothetical protein